MLKKKPENPNIYWRRSEEEDERGEEGLVNESFELILHFGPCHVSIPQEIDHVG